MLKTFSRLSNMAAYQIRPVKLGAEVRGIDLKKDIPSEVVKKIKQDVTEHRILIFKDQGLASMCKNGGKIAGDYQFHASKPEKRQKEEENKRKQKKVAIFRGIFENISCRKVINETGVKVSAERHVAVTRWFGELTSDSFFSEHPKCPHRHIFRLSNDKEHGLVGFGGLGWHIDGSFLKHPHAYSFYHIVSVPKSGATLFAPLTEIVEGLPTEQRARWERLSMLSDKKENPIHPLIYAHPITKKPVMCFHLGMTDKFVWDYGTENERYTDKEETKQLLDEINHEFIKNDGAIQYKHEWCAGDFVMADNLAVAHLASAESKLPISEVGLRVLHRTTVAGTHTPDKNYATS